MFKWENKTEMNLTQGFPLGSFSGYFPISGLNDFILLKRH